MKNDKSLTKLAREQRTRPTDAESVLWAQLCNRQLAGAKFRRQQQIDNYIVDFVCF
jgi:very-short-patch-repair endonuclease